MMPETSPAASSFEIVAGGHERCSKIVRTRRQVLTGTAPLQPVSNYGLLSVMTYAKTCSRFHEVPRRRMRVKSHSKTVCIPLVKIQRGKTFNLFVLSILSALAGRAGAQGLFTIQVGPPNPPISLVAHTNTWRYHKGTNAPPAGWQTNAEATLGNMWATGSGGFGYADNSTEVTNVQTSLPDMLNRYTTFYARRSFDITNAIDPDRELMLRMDWDDGFVAWLDGAELPRMFAPGAAGTEPVFTATATGSHESSQGNNQPQPAMTFALGSVGNRLQPGTHVLAMLGLNQATNSSDFILVPDLFVGGAAGIVNGSLLSIAKTNAVLLSGSNTLSGAAHVLVNGVEAPFDSVTGIWSQTVSLTAGFNRLLLQVLDAGGVQLLATNQDIVAELTSVSVGGVLGSNTGWSNSMGVFHVTNTLIVPPGGNLWIGPGCVFLFSPGTHLLTTNGTITADGTEDSPVCFAPADGSTVWGGLAASGINAHLHAQHVETSAGHVELFDGAEGSLADSYFHDYTISSPAIIHTLGEPNHCNLTLTRCHVARYYEVLSQLSTNHFEDCLMENPEEGGDGIDFDAGQPGSVIRRCTVRHGKFTNVDALDMGEYGPTGEGSRGILIESCLLYDFVDKGVSMGVQVDVAVTNCLIHDVDSAIAVKDLSTAGIYNCTLASNTFGFHCYNKANPSSPTGGGFITNSFNNILWGNGQSFALLNGSTLTASYSDFEGTNVSGAGNVNLKPAWVAPAGGDFTLASNSPLLGAGRDGANMGAVFPVGAEMASSHPVVSSVETSNTNVIFRFWADSERTYSVLQTDFISGGTWTKLADVFPTPLPRQVAITNNIVAGHSRFYRLVSPRQP
jgi:hypothetical protein